MKKKSFTVIADDLTGACEIAAIGHGPGLRSVVSMSRRLATEEADLVVFDTETRLSGAEGASLCMRELAGQIQKNEDTRFLFKKTDSVMRGPVAAEISTLMQVMGMRRAILVPANPHLGRIIENGIYTINGIPLDQTPFSADLHHPAQSADVRQLLGPVPGFAVHLAKPGDKLPREGIIIGDAASEEDLLKWAGEWNDETLLAGSGGFFQALIKSINRLASNWHQPMFKRGRHLLVSGTTHSTQQAFLERLEAAGIQTVSGTTENTGVAAGREWADCLLDKGCKSHGCLLRMQAQPEPDPRNAAWVREQLAQATAIVVSAGRLEHLIIEGGATAASITTHLGWEVFEVRHVWGAGVVSLSPFQRPEIIFTIKPGSYPWPPSFIKEIWPELLELEPQGNS